MADKLAWKLSSGLLLALAVGLLIQPAVLARGDDGGRSSYIPGTHAGGYPIGTQSSGQYASGGGYGRNRGASAPWWWSGGAYGGGGYGGGFIPGTTYGGYGYGYATDPSNQQALYPTADGPQPSTTPHPDYQTEMMDAQMSDHSVQHQAGPSMGFESEAPDNPKTSSYFSGFWNDINAGNGGAQVAAQGGGGQVSAQLASNTPPVTARANSKNFDHPKVQSRLSPVQFDSSVAVRTELKPRLEEAEQMFLDMKTSNQLGTFDIDPLEQQLSDLKRRAREVDNIQNSVEQQAEEGRLINAISDFEYQLKQHIDRP